MKRSWILALGLAVLAPVGFLGCAEESSVTTEKKVETPNGSVKETTESTIEKTGDAKTNP